MGGSTATPVAVAAVQGGGGQPVQPMQPVQGVIVQQPMQPMQPMQAMQPVHATVSHQQQPVAMWQHQAPPAPAQSNVYGSTTCGGGEGCSWRCFSMVHVIFEAIEIIVCAIAAWVWLIWVATDWGEGSNYAASVSVSFGPQNLAAAVAATTVAAFISCVCCCVGKGANLAYKIALAAAAFICFLRFISVCVLLSSVDDCDEWRHEWEHEWEREWEGRDGEFDRVTKCGDSGADCCASEPDGDPAVCAPGYAPNVQPQNYYRCPNYRCDPVPEPLGGSGCVDLAVTNFDSVPGMSCTEPRAIECDDGYWGMLDGARVPSTVACCHCGGGRSGNATNTSAAGSRERPVPPPTTSSPTPRGRRGDDDDDDDDDDGDDDDEDCWEEDPLDEGVVPWLVLWGMWVATIGVLRCFGLGLAWRWRPPPDAAMPAVGRAGGVAHGP